MGVLIRCAVAALCMAAWLSCQREFTSPYLPDSGTYVGSEWSRDSDGNGVADSVEKYAPGCSEGSDACLRRALAAADGQSHPPVAGLDSVVVEDLSLLVGAPAAPPRYHCFPEVPGGARYTLLSENPGVAAIVDGKIKPVAQGNTTVTLTAYGADGNPRAAAFKVAVTRKRVPVASIKAEDMTLLVGDEAAPSVTFSPKDADDPRYELTSRNPEIAEARGLTVVGKAKGTARITVRALDGGGAQAEFKVKVSPKLLDVDGDDMELQLGEAPRAPTLIFTPADAATDDYVLSGGMPGIAEVTPDGKRVMAEGSGTALFTINVGGMVYSLFAATVTTPPPPVVRVISVAVKDMELFVTAWSHSRKPPEVTWDPPDAADKDYSLTSSNPLVAFVIDGEVEGLVPGETTVTLSTHDGAQQATFHVKVTLLVSQTPDGKGKGKGKGDGKA